MRSRSRCAHHGNVINTTYACVFVAAALAAAARVHACTSGADSALPDLTTAAAVVLLPSVPRPAREADSYLPSVLASLARAWRHHTGSGLRPAGGEPDGNKYDGEFLAGPRLAVVVYNAASKAFVGRAGIIPGTLRRRAHRHSVFEQLRTDPSIQKLNASGMFEVHFVTAQQLPCSLHGRVDSHVQDGPSWLRRWISQVPPNCPAACQSCNEGGNSGVGLVNGICLAFCSQHGYCGEGSDYIAGGADCGACKVDSWWKRRTVHGAPAELCATEVSTDARSCTGARTWSFLVSIGV